MAHNADAASVICQACGATCSADAAFCRNCGAALSSPEPAGKICPACGAENDADANFCRECGRKLDGEDCGDTPPVSDQTGWEAFRPESEPARPDDAAGVPDEAEPAETVRMDTTEPAGVFRKSDSFDAAPGDKKPAEGNPFMRKASDL